MHSGKYIFSQIIEFIPRYEFDKLVKRYNGDFHSRNMSCYNQLLHLLFGQLTVCNSIRDICLCLKAHQRNLYHLGFRKTVNESSLSRANETRDYRIYEGLGSILINKVRPLYKKESVPGLFLPEYEIFALDSTTISCSIKLLTWALGKYAKGAVKMHTLLDLRGNIPAFIHVTHGKWHDSNALDIIEPVPFAIYTMDKAYVDFAPLFRIDQNNAYFVTRAKNNMKFEILERNYNLDKTSGLRSDCTINLTGYKPKRLYPKSFRMVEYYDSENDELLRFITNNFDISALEVANIYRNRWQIEIFFKWIKQNLTIKNLWGHSENAVKTQLWMAICTYLIVAKIRAVYKSPYTITECATLLSVAALEKVPISDLISFSEPFIQNQIVKEQNLFNF